MSVTIGGGCVVVRSTAIEAKVRGGVPQLLSDSHAAAYSTDGKLLALTCPGDPELASCIGRLEERGFARDEFAEAMSD